MLTRSRRPKDPVATPPTLAQGCAWFALLVVASTAFRALLGVRPGMGPASRVPGASASAPAVMLGCSAPIEVVEASGFVRVGCACEAVHWGCPKVAPGARVIRRGSTSCHVQEDGMRVGWMLSWGLPLNINQRSALELAQVAGISAALAERIVAHRQAHGPFADVQGLLAVRGVGAKSLARLASSLSAGS